MRSYLPLLLVAVVLMSALTGCNSTESHARVPKANPVAAPAQQAAAPADGVRRISIAEARAELDGGKAVVVDVRGDATYKLGHIKGSVSIPVSDVEARMKELPKDKVIIFYCSCPAEQSSIAAGKALHAKGMDNTAALVGGYPAWKSAGYPVVE